MIKVAICDDEVHIAGYLEKIILDTCKMKNIPVETEVFYNGISFEKEIEQGAKYDLLYLDIQMQDEDGIAVAKKIREADENILIIFVSGYDKYLMDLFCLDVFDFIKKPIDEARLIMTFLKANSKICSKNYYYIYSYKNREEKVLLRDVLYFESKGNK